MKTRISSIYTLLFLCILIFPSFQKNKKKQPISVTEIRNYIISNVKSNNKVFNWKDANTHLLYSTLIHSDSIAVVGYKPSNLREVRKNLKKSTNTTQEWQSAKQIAQTTVIEYYQEEYGNKYSFEQIILPNSIDERLPFFYAKIFDYNIIKKLRNDENIRYIEPVNFKLNNNSYKKMERKCGEGVRPSDKVYVNEHCDYHSWSFIHHNIPQAWEVSTKKGQGIKVAVLDEGISQYFIDDFNKGESYGRTFEGHNELPGFWDLPFPETDPLDYLGSCTTHATKIAGVIAGPKTNEGDAFGIAYQSNLKHYRVTAGLAWFNVFITADEVEPVANALMDAIDSDVKIINMSIGNIIVNVDPIEDALSIINNDTEIIVFAAAGSADNIPLVGAVVYPASSIYTKAVTGITLEGNKCNKCHDGPEVDFAAYVENESGRDVVAYGGQYSGVTSVATATISGITALLWAENPNWTRNEILDRLELASTDVGNDPVHGHGVVDAYKALTMYDAPQYISSNWDCRIPTIYFYEGNNATQDNFCKVEIPDNTYTIFDFHDHETCKHDEARSMILYDFPSGKSIRLYNDRNGDINEAWMDIRIVDDISEKIISSFENNIIDNEINAIYYHKSGTDGLDGKVSKVDIFNSPPIPVFVSNIDLEPNCDVLGISQFDNSITLNNLQISNLGDAGTSGFKIFYSLTNTTETFELGFQAISQLAAFSTITVSPISLSIQNFPTGNYYLKVYVESDYFLTSPFPLLVEYDLTNNNCISNSQITLSGNSPTCDDGIQNQGELDIDCGGPCLPCQPVNLKSTGCATPLVNGDEVTILYQIMNTGSINSGPFYTGWSLKEVGSSNFSPFGVLAYNSGINAVTSEALSVVFDLDQMMDMADLQAGNYELYMSIDILNDVTESSESDNWCTNLSTINYTTTNLTSSGCVTTQIVGDYLNAYYDITNSGNQEAGIFTISWFVLENGSNIIVAFGDEHQIVGLPANTTTPFARSFHLPQAMSEANLTFGTYSLGFYIDSYDNINESSEMDNICISSSPFNYTENCDSNGNFQGVYNGTFYYAAPNYINAPAQGNQCTILPGSDVTLTAGNYLMLKPGFMAEYNSNFLAFIDGCEGAFKTTDSNKEVLLNSSALSETNIDLSTIGLSINPNPFTDQSIIQFNHLSANTPVTVFVTDMMGNKVVSLADNEQMNNGIHQLIFDGSDLPLGMYYCTLMSGDMIKTEKVMIIK